jgi:hypothetical protein
LSRWDWLVIATIVATVHVLVFEEVFRALHVYPNLGPWRWSFDRNGALYLLFTGLTVYIYIRSRSTHLSRRNLALFERLITSLLHARKFEELGVLMEHHLEAVFRIANARGARSRVQSWLRPPAPALPAIRIVDGQLVEAPTPSLPWATARFVELREWSADVVAPSAEPMDRAENIVRATLASRDFVAYLAMAHPYLCLQVMERVEALVDDFQDNFFEALLANEASVFYSEIKNSQNLDGGHRLRIPSENRLLSFYLKDVTVAGRLGVYRSIGEAVLSRLSSDAKLVEQLNGPMRSYREVEAYRCPIYCGIYFFRVMVLEGLYQKVNDHLWLHYVTHFADRILSATRAMKPEDENDEFASRFSYLLCELVDVTADWIEEAAQVTGAADHVEAEQTEGQHAYISFQASEALGAVTQSVLRSDKLTERLKDELLEVVLFSLRRIEKVSQLVPLARAVAMGLVQPHGFPAREGYFEDLAERYGRQDYHVRSETRMLGDLLEAKGSVAGH